MKKVLLASTALIGMGFISGAALAAESKVTVGGSAEFQAGFFDNDTGAPDSARDFLTNTEVHVKADFKADNGLQYGAYIEIENTRGTTNSALDYDEANIYVQGAFGRVEAGDQDGAVTQLIVYAPTVGIGQLDGEAEKFLNDIGVYSFYVDLQDNSKVTYITPRFAGFQAGVSYTPEHANQGDNVVRAKTTANSRDVVEGALNYTNEFGPVTVEASATILSADGDNTANPGSDYTSWTAGLRLGYAGIQVGGGYADLDQSNAAYYSDRYDADHAWNVGIAYSAGPFGVAAQYASINLDGNKDIDQIGVGGTYTLAPGLTLNADYLFIDNAAANSGAGAENSLLILGTKVAF